MEKKNTVPKTFIEYCDYVAQFGFIFNRHTKDFILFDNDLKSYEYIHTSNSTIFYDGKYRDIFARNLSISKDYICISKNDIDLTAFNHYKNNIKAGR